MKKFLLTAAASSAFLAPALVFAEGETESTFSVPTLVTAEQVTGGILNNIGPWLLAGLGIAASVLIVRLGYGLFKKFVGRG